MQDPRWYSLATLLVSDGHHTSRNNWTGKGGTEKVYILEERESSAHAKMARRQMYLVDTVSLEGGVNELGDELALEILYTRQLRLHR